MKRNVHAFIVIVCFGVALAVAIPQFPQLPFAAVKKLGGIIPQVAQRVSETIPPIQPPIQLSKLKDLLILPNFDCDCSGYEEKAKKCNWPDTQCNPISQSFINYFFWCNSINRFRDAKRKGIVNNTFVQNLSCLSNLSLLQRQLTQLGLKVPENISPKPLPKEALPTSDVSIPSSINWISKMSTVRNQGECASCYAFSSVALCEWYLSSSTIIISLQFHCRNNKYLVDCNDLDHGCAGGWPSRTLSLMENGISTSAYSYKGKTDDCQKSSHEPKVKCPKGIEENYPKGNDTRLQQLLTRGPVVGAIHVSEDFFEYSGGLYSSNNCTGKVNHAIVIVGYGNEPVTGKPAWIVRNSWGEDWGDKGHIWIDSSTENICELSKWFWYYAN